MNKAQELELRKIVLGSYLLNFTVMVLGENTIRWRSGPSTRKLHERIFDTRKDTVDVRGKRLKSLARAYGISLTIEEKNRKLLINITLNGTESNIRSGH